jgi:hypothetical protein
MWSYMWKRKSKNTVSFCCWDKIPEKANLILIFAHTFRGFSPWLIDSIALSLSQDRTSRWKGMIEQRRLTSWQSGSRKWTEGQGQDIPLDSTSPVTSDPFPPTSPHLLIDHSAMGSSRDSSIDGILELLWSSHLSIMPPAWDQAFYTWSFWVDTWYPTTIDTQKRTKHSSRKAIISSIFK